MTSTQTQSEESIHKIQLTYQMKNILLFGKFWLNATTKMVVFNKKKE